MAANEYDELVELLERRFFQSDATTGLECAIEAVNFITENTVVVLRALGCDYCGDHEHSDGSVWAQWERRSS